MGKHSYPDLDELITILRRMAAKVVLIDSTGLAARAGDSIVQNIVMVGALAGSGCIPIPQATFASVIDNVAPEKALDINKKAFQLGYSAAHGKPPMPARHNYIMALTAALIFISTTFVTLRRG